MQVRHYNEKDKINFRLICTETADASALPLNEQKFFTLLYCDYYIEREPQNCFALTDDNDNAVGYIICSENFEKYKKGVKPYIASIRNISFSKYIFALGEVFAHGILAKKYPAHLHIDILPSFQHMGGGTQLVSALREHLASKGIHSLMLIVNGRNTNAVKFYLKNGFTKKMSVAGAIYMTSDF